MKGIFRELPFYQLPMVVAVNKQAQIVDQGDIWNMAFLDNNGLVLEAAWPKQRTG